MQIYFTIAYMINNPDISSAIILDTRRPLIDGTFPLKLRITYLRKQKYFKLKNAFSKDLYAKIATSRPRGEHKDLQFEINLIEEKAIEIINDLQDDFAEPHPSLQAG